MDASTSRQDIALARRLLRAADRAALATSLPDGWPYASLVTMACDDAGAPILLLSDLAAHTKNLAIDPRVSLLIDGTADRDGDPLAGARLTVLGRAAATDAPERRARFLTRNPAARVYADFADFRFYQVAVERAHLVAGFGRIRWLTAADLLADAGGRETREAPGPS